MPMDWREFRAAVVEAIDVRAEYEKLGVRIVDGATAKDSGWLGCYAVGREDNKPSAAINVHSGYYKDSGTGTVVGLWDFAAEHGRFADWKDAFNYYAKDVAKIPEKDFPKDWSKDWREKVYLHRAYSKLTVRGFLKAYPGVTFEALQYTGARLADYPKKAPEPFSVLAWPMQGPTLFEETPTGVVIQSTDGRKLPIYQGKDKPSELRKRSTIGKSGFVGMLGLKLLEAGKAEVVFKVEGMSDLLALQSIVPEDCLRTHAVITNASGAGESELPKQAAGLFAGANVVLVHDHDEAGQNGAKKWVGILREQAKTIRNVQLKDGDPDEKHGFDLRDWIAEQPTGEAWQNFLTLVAQTNIYEAAAEGEFDENALTGDQEILKNLGIVTMGHTSAGKVKIFTIRDGRVWEVRDLTRYSAEQLMLHVGREAFDRVIDGSREKLNLVRLALAAEANSRRADDDKQFGAGCWELNGRIALVGSGEALIFNGGVERTKIPFRENRLFDFDCEPWFDADRVDADLEKSKSHQWCQKQFAEAVSLFEGWDNWQHSDLPLLITSLICCSWLQTIWPIRPMIAVSGPTNSGKTVFLKTIESMFGTLALSVAKPSEAGIRQFVGNSARILMIDEFEADRHRAAILELLRTSTRGQQMIRGTAGHGGTRFGLKHIVWLGAIELGLTDAADANRVIGCDLTSRDKRKGNALTLPTTAELSDLGLRLLIVALRHWRAALGLLEDLRRHGIGEHDSRLIEIYSVPVAMAGAVHGLDKAQTLNMLTTMLDLRSSETNVETDESTLMGELLGSDVRLKGSQYTIVSDLLNQWPEHEAKDALAKVGVGCKHKDGKTYVFIATRLVRQKLLTKGKTAEKDIRKIFGRIDGAFDHRMSLLGSLCRGWLIPIDEIPGLQMNSGDFL